MKMELTMRNSKYHNIISILISVLILGTSTLFAQSSFWLKDIVDSNGKSFRLKINQKTGSPHRVYGMKANLNDYGFINAKSIEGLSRQFIADKAKTLRVKSENLKLKQLSTRNGKWIVNFQQTYKGVPVYGADVGFTLNEAGKVISLGSDSHPGIDLDVSPAITAATALDVALSDFGNVDSVNVRKGPDLVVLPNETDKGFNYQLAYYTEIIAKDPGISKGEFHFINAQDGSIVASGSLIMDYSISGEVQTKYWLEHYYDSQSTGYYNYGRITCTPLLGQTLNDYTDSDGDYLFSSLAYGIYFITGNLYGTYVDINGDGSSHSSGGMTPGVHNWTWNATNGSNVYYHVTKIHDWIKASPFNYSGMDYRMVATVNRGGGVNGGSTGINIEFGSQGGYYWARSSDVIYHEYTHCIIYHLYGNHFIAYGVDPSLQAYAMDEGLSDYFSATINDEADVGESVGVNRDLDNTKSYSAGQSMYWNGEVIGGACWDLRQSEVAESDVNELVFDALEMTPHAYDFAEFADNVVIADDDDADVSNGTPHIDAILYAFENHLIYPSDPDVPPAAPTNLSVSGGWLENPTLSWDANTEPDLDEYVIYRSPPEKPWYVQVGTTSNTSWVDTGVLLGPPLGLWKWYVKAVDDDGNSSNASNIASAWGVDKMIGEGREFSGIPTVYSLEQNYPNPFNPETKIQFSLPEDSNVKLEIFNLQGQIVATLVDGSFPAGFHTARFDATSFPSGVYFYKIVAGNFTDIKRMLLIK
jgi:hypothetical protein